MAYGEDTMLPVEIEMSSWRRAHVDEEENVIGLKCAKNMIDKLQEASRVWEFSVKHRATKSYKSKVKPKEMQEVDLVLKEVVIPT